MHIHVACEFHYPLLNTLISIRLTLSLITIYNKFANSFANTCHISDLVTFVYYQQQRPHYYLLPQKKEAVSEQKHRTAKTVFNVFKVKCDHYCCP